MLECQATTPTLRASVRWRKVELLPPINPTSHSGTVRRDAVAP
jgi:hypothetical protein